MLLDSGGKPLQRVTPVLTCGNVFPLRSTPWAKLDDCIGREAEWIVSLTWYS